MRELNELIGVDDPAWPALRKEFAGASVPVEVLPGDADRGRACLLQLQVSAASFLGALVLHSGGLLLDHGWLRVYGGGCRHLPGLAAVNHFPAGFDPAWRPLDGLVIGHDALGGVFALNGHDPAAAGRPGAPGQVVYFAPDSLGWEPLEIGYATWVTWLLSGRLDQFYDGLRWPGWQTESAGLGPGQGIVVYPFLWSEEARANLAATTRHPVSLRELLGISADSCRQLGLRDPGFLGAV